MSKRPSPDAGGRLNRVVPLIVGAQRYGLSVNFQSSANAIGATQSINSSHLFIESDHAVSRVCSRAVRTGSPSPGQTRAQRLRYSHNQSSITDPNVLPERFF